MTDPNERREHELQLRQQTPDSSDYSPAEQVARDRAEFFIDVANEINRRKKRNLLQYWYPDEDVEFNGAKYYARSKYPRALSFWDAGSKYATRLFDGANQTGKTYAVACEVVYHITGLYPTWWTGKRLTGPNRWWVAGETNKDTRDIMQDRLLGPVDERGTGLIPYFCIDFTSMVETEKADTPIPTVRVRHHDENGNVDGMSTISFKSYAQGRRSFQGLPRHCWLDEEPPLDVYSECVARTTSSDDYLMLISFTPLQGWSTMLGNFLPGGWPGPITGNEGWQGPISDSKYMVVQTAFEVPHITPAKLATLELDYHPHVRDARLRGVPSMGSGAIYPIAKSEWVIPDFDIPKHWKKCYGLDVGFNWTAAVWLTINPDTGVAYLYSEHKMSQTEPVGHAEIIRSRGLWIPGVIDSAANGRGQDGGESLINQYTALGLEVSNANKSVEAGIYAVWTAMKSGFVKVFTSCQASIKELENYHRDEKGKIVKSNDHICDCFRYAMMSGLDIAKQEPVLTQRSHGISPQFRGAYR